MILAVALSIVLVAVGVIALSGRLDASTHSALGFDRLRLPSTDRSRSDFPTSAWDVTAR